MLDLLTQSGATYSPCEKYRYHVWYEWDERLPTLAFLMLNPSTATAETLDPTVTRCKTRAERGGFGRLEIINLFAWRATDPKEMKKHSDPVGPENDHWILETVAKADKTIAGWGNHGAHCGRSDEILEQLREHGLKLHALKVTGQGHPQHPLYLGYGARPIPFP